MRAARLHAAKAFIAANIERQNLSVGRVAAHFEITPRYLHMLFETDGLSLTKFVVEQRLARCHQMLLDPRMAGHTISAIAFAAGFSDLSHFNRASVTLREDPIGRTARELTTITCRSKIVPNHPIKTADYSRKVASHGHANVRFGCAP